MKTSKFIGVSSLIAVLVAFFPSILAIFFGISAPTLSSHGYFTFFFWSITAISYWVVYKSLHDDPEKSVFLILGTVVAKLLLSMILALVFIYTQRPPKIPFLITFFSPYFILSSFEIYSLMSNLRALKK